MKFLINTLMAITLVISFSACAGTGDVEKGHEKKEQMMQMMSDAESRSMMMDQIAADPGMRREMMQKMKQSMSMDSDMHMHMHMQKMMSDPEKKAQMQKHMEMMQAMMDSDGMDKARMQEMMSDPEMKSMMQMHMMCAQMMNGEMKGETSEESTEEHDHEE